MTHYGRVNCDLRRDLFIDLFIENNDPLVKKYGEKCYRDFAPRINLTNTVEELLAINSDGQYNFIDGVHEDFDDQSEAKTGTIYVFEKSTSHAEITNVRSKDGVLKKGAIRCVILDTLEEKLRFLFIPHYRVKEIMSTTKSTSLKLTYNKKKRCFSGKKMDGIIEFETFKELAMEPNR